MQSEAALVNGSSGSAAPTAMFGLGHTVEWRRVSDQKPITLSLSSSLDSSGVARAPAPLMTLQLLSRRLGIDGAFSDQINIKEKLLGEVILIHCLT